MYKAGKSWMVAGLMTTAVLAGLTLGNVNATEVHADTNVPVAAATQKQNVTQEQYNAQSAVVAKDASAVATQQGRVNDAQSALNNAQNANSGAKAVADASAAYSAAAQKRNDAQSAADKAYGNWVTARAAVSAADTQNVAGQTKTLKWFHDQWVKSGSANYEKDQQKLTNWKNAESDAQAAVNQASDALKASQKAGNDAHNSLSDAQNELTSANAMSDVASDVKQSAIDKANADIASATKLISYYREANTKNNNALQDAKAKLQQAQRTIRGLQKQYLPADQWHQKMAEKYDKLVQALNDATTASKEANTLRDDTKTLADQAWQDWRQARLDNLLPSETINEPGKNISELEAMSHRANGAQNEINRIKNNNPAEKSATDAQKNIDKLSGWIKDDNTTMSYLKTMVDKTTEKLNDAKARKAAAKKDSPEYVSAQSDVDTYSKLLSNDTKTGYQDKLDAATKTNTQHQKDLQSWKDALAKIQASQDYIDAEGRIADQQKIVDDYNTAVKNVKAVKDGQGALNELQTKLNNAQKSLSALQDIYNHDKAALDNMAVNGQTPSDDHHNDQPSDHGNTGSNTGNKGNQGNAGNQNQGTTTEGNKTTTEGQKSNATVKTTQKSVAATSAKSATKKNAATTAKAKKLPQTGNNSAAVVALGALSGMLGLGLAAKKREF